MLHEFLYTLHVFGMAVIIGISLFLAVKKDIAPEVHKKLSLYLLSAAHTQLLSGFGLFLLMLADVNHMKIGIKMLLAIEVAVFATMYRKKIANNETINPAFILIILSSSILTTVIAFLL